MTCRCSRCGAGAALCSPIRHGGPPAALPPCRRFCCCQCYRCRCPLIEVFTSSPPPSPPHTLQVGGGVIEVLSTGGDANLGGDDWDGAIMQWLIDTQLKPARIDCTVRRCAG